MWLICAAPNLVVELPAIASARKIALSRGEGFCTRTLSRSGCALMCHICLGVCIEEWTWAALERIPAVVNASGFMNGDSAVFILAIVAVQSEYPCRE